MSVLELNKKVTKTTSSITQHLVSLNGSPVIWTLGIYRAKFIENLLNAVEYGIRLSATANPNIS